MSAWICDNKHIDFLVTGMIPACNIPDDAATATGRILLAENYLSVNHRYPRKADPDNDKFIISTYRFRLYQKFTGTLSALSHIECYKYQSDEHPEWKTSRAYEMIERLEEFYKNKLPEGFWKRYRNTEDRRRNTPWAIHN